MPPRTQTFLDNGNVFLLLALKVDATFTTDVFDDLQGLVFDRVVLVLFDTSNLKIEYFRARFVAVLRHAGNLPVQVARRRRVIFARSTSQQRLVHWSMRVLQREERGGRDLREGRARFQNGSEDGRDDVLPTTRVKETLDCETSFSVVDVAVDRWLVL